MLVKGLDFNLPLIISGNIENQCQLTLKYMKIPTPILLKLKYTWITLGVQKL